MSNETRVGEYTILHNEMIGQGSEGMVLKCKQINGSKICVKVLNVGLNQNELVILQQLKESPHPNIIKIWDIVSRQGQIFIFMEELDCNIQQYMEDRKQYWLSTDEIYSIFSQIVSGYMHLRQLNIIHRDLKPSNLLCKKLVNNRIIMAITGFQVGKHLDSEQARTKAGTPFYQAPEIFYQSGDSYDDRCDIFSLGIILYQLCYQGEKHINIRTYQELTKFCEQLQFQRFQCPKDNRVDDSLVSLIEKMIVYDPNKRITWQQLSYNPKLQPKFLILEEKYLIDLGKTLGNGAQGVTFLAANLQNNQQYCAKRIKSGTEESKREISIYEKIKLDNQKNQNIIEIIDIIQTKEDHYLILEKCDENIKEYFEKQQSFSAKEILDIMQQITNGYLYLMKLQIIHRDIKPENLLLKHASNKITIKIIDFGVGKILQKQRVMASTQAGTPCYSAPEIFIGDEYNHQCDIFSLGVMCYELVFQRQLIQAFALDELINKLKQLKYNAVKCDPKMIKPQNSGEAQELATLIERMLKFEPSQRITWEELDKYLRTPRKIKVLTQFTMPFAEIPPHIDNNPNNLKMAMETPTPDDTVDIFKRQKVDDIPKTNQQQFPPSSVQSQNYAFNAGQKQIPLQNNNPLGVQFKQVTQAQPNVVNSSPFQPQIIPNQNFTGVVTIPKQNNANFINKSFEPQQINNGFEKHTNGGGQALDSKINFGQKQNVQQNFNKFIPQKNENNLSQTQYPTKQYPEEFIRSGSGSFHEAPEPAQKKNNMPTFQPHQLQNQIGFNQKNNNFSKTPVDPKPLIKQQQFANNNLQNLQDPNIIQPRMQTLQVQNISQSQQLKQMHFQPSPAMSISLYLETVKKIGNSIKITVDNQFSNPMSPQKIVPYLSGLLILFNLIIEQCCSDIIQLIDKREITLDGKVYQNKSQLQKEIQKNDKEQCAKSRNEVLGKLFNWDRNDKIIQEITNIHQQSQQLSKNQTTTFIEILKLYQKFQDRFHFNKDIQFPIEFRFSVVQMYYLLEDFPVQEINWFIQASVLKGKNNEEMKKYLATKSQNFFTDQQ